MLVPIPIMPTAWSQSAVLIAAGAFIAAVQAMARQLRSQFFAAMQVATHRRGS